MLAPRTSCCPPDRDTAANETAMLAVRQSRLASTSAKGRIFIPGDKALVGTNNAVIVSDGESPLRQKRTRSFWIGATVVTNSDFDAFVSATGYVTEAEQFGWSFVFWDHVDTNTQFSQGVQDVEWWRRVDGANWRDIDGPGSQPTSWFPDHPVVHVSWNDANAYANWVGGRLPREAEWEHAARGGLGDVRFPWGNAEPDDTEYFPCNIWQGDFPGSNLCLDGYARTAPAKSFEANGYGLYNMVGNVWEWCAEPFVIRSLQKGLAVHKAQARGKKLLKGGSFLCHRSYCYRYRIAARTGNTPDTSTSHMGFRIVWDDKSRMTKLD